jgi:hypothetical protein
MSNNNFRDDRSIYSDDEYNEQTGYGKPVEESEYDVSHSNNGNSQRIIHLKQSQNLIENGLVKYAVYEIDTNNIKISLNHDANSDIIFTIDKKKWQNNHKFLLDEAEEYGINGKEQRLLLKRLLNDNENLILADYNNKSSNKKSQQHQEEETTTEHSGGSGGGDTAELLLDLFNEQEPQPVLFKDQFKVPHALVNIENHYQVLPIEDPKFRKYLTLLYYDNLNEIPNSEAVRNVVQYLAAKSTYKGDTIALYLRAAWSNSEARDSIYYDMSDNKNRCVKITADEWAILENQTDWVIIILKVMFFIYLSYKIKI